jgi:hypothetical protein
MMLGCRDDARFPAQTADKHVRAHGFTEVCCYCADSHHNLGDRRKTKYQRIFERGLPFFNPVQINTDI